MDIPMYEFEEKLDYVNFMPDRVPYTLTEARKELKAQVESLQAWSNDTLVYSNEGLWQITKNILTCITNLLVRILNTFKTGVFKFFKPLKRTELRYYYESNLVSVRRMWNLPYTEVSTMDCPFPNGMKTTYLDALSKNSQALSQIDILTRATVAVQVAEELLYIIKKGDVIDKALDDALSRISLTDILPTVQIAQKCFDPKANTTTDTKPFKQFFLSMEDLKKCHEIAMESEQYADIAHPTHKKMVKCSDIFTDIVKQVERTAGNTMNKAELEKLANVAYTLADTFDIFSALMFEYHKLEHNLVEVYRQIDRVYDV